MPEREERMQGPEFCKGKGYVMTPTAKECVAAGGKPETTESRLGDRSDEAFRLPDARLRRRA